MRERHHSRRQIIKAAGSGVALTLVAPMLNLGRVRLFASEATYSTRCVDLVGESLVIDMLSPLTINGETQERWGAGGEGFSDADRAEFRASGIDVFHYAFGIGGATPHDYYDNTLAYVASLNALIASRPDAFMRIDSAEDLGRVREADRVGILIGVQDAAHFQRVEDVDLFHALGQRVAQLTYNSRNLIGNGSTERIDGGVSDFGAAIIARMNEKGMTVDVSHCGDRTTLDAFELSSKPVLITHSNARTLCPGHPRCKTDEAIRAMAAAGGVMGITGVRMFVKNDEPTTLDHYLDHFDHVRDLVGIEHVGVGSDVDLHGYDDLPTEQYENLKANYKDTYAFREKIDIEGVDHPKRMFDLTEGLLARGYTDEHVRQVLGENFRRVLIETWESEPAAADAG